MLKLKSSDTKLDFDDVLLVPSRTTTASRKAVQLERPFKFYHSTREWNGIPIMAANMYATGSLDMANEMMKHRMVSCLHKHHEIRALVSWFEIQYREVQDYCWLSMGLDRTVLDDIYSVNGWVPNLCIDVANGYTETFVKFCKEIREDYPEAIIMAGNVCTPEQTQELIINGGVDIVKVGIGPGSVCTTRLKTGVGYPQLSAIAECAHAAHGLMRSKGRIGLVCSDGGCVRPGDICKAFGANADFVMLGGMLAGTDECDGEWKFKYHNNQLVGKEYLKFYGMSSKEAQEEHNGGMENYKASEGRCVKVPYKGPVSEVLQDITGGLRSACSYLGATSLKDMAKCASFVKVNNTHNRSMT